MLKTRQKHAKNKENSFLFIFSLDQLAFANKTLFFHLDSSCTINHAETELKYGHVFMQLIIILLTLSKIYILQGVGLIGIILYMLIFK